MNESLGNKNDTESLIVREPYEVFDAKALFAVVDKKIWSVYLFFFLTNGLTRVSIKQAQTRFTMITLAHHPRI